MSNYIRGMEEFGNPEATILPLEQRVARQVITFLREQTDKLPLGSPLQTDLCNTVDGLLEYAPDEDIEGD